jgi:hypothetical protein
MSLHRQPGSGGVERLTPGADEGSQQLALRSGHNHQGSSDTSISTRLILVPIE